MFSIGAVFKVKTDGQLAGMIGKLVDIQIIDGHEVATLDTNDGNVLCVYLDRLEATNEAMPLNEDQLADLQQTTASYVVIDRQTGQQVGKQYNSRVRASRRVDALDNAYGAYRYYVRSI